MLLHVVTISTERCFMKLLLTSNDIVGQTFLIHTEQNHTDVLIDLAPQQKQAKSRAQDFHQSNYFFFEFQIIISTHDPLLSCKIY